MQYLILISFLFLFTGLIATSPVRAIGANYTIPTDFAYSYGANDTICFNIAFAGNTSSALGFTPISNNVIIRYQIQSITNISSGAQLKMLISNTTNTNPDPNNNNDWGTAIQKTLDVNDTIDGLILDNMVPILPNDTTLDEIFTLGFPLAFMTSTIATSILYPYAFLLENVMAVFNTTTPVVTGRMGAMSGNTQYTDSFNVTNMNLLDSRNNCR